MIRTVLCILAAAALAAADFAIDPSQSTIAFAGTSTFHDFTGTAKLKSGSLHLDAAAPSGTIEADAASMTTSDEDRDERMHNFVMDAPTFPTVSFALTGWVPDASGGGTATGTWTMKGVGKPISIPVAIAGGHAKAHFELNIRDWGIRTPRLLFVTVGDIVTIDLDLVLMPAATP
jgi:polyisoprenoid-binding protein YceI